MLEFLKKEATRTLTLNGGQTRSTSGSHCLDLFFRAGAMRNAAPDEIADVVRCAYAEDPVRTMKTLFFVRDVRGGLGERRFFRIALHTLAKEEPDAVLRNIGFIPEYGRYDDICALLHTHCEDAASAGCAAAILEHFYRRGIEIFAEYKYYPNQVVYHKVFDALESAAFQPTEYLRRVYDYSGTDYPFDRYVIEKSLNRLTLTEKDILYLYLWEKKSVLSIADQYGYSDLRIEQILSKCHRQLAHYITGYLRR